MSLYQHSLRKAGLLQVKSGTLIDGKSIRVSGIEIRENHITYILGNGRVHLAFRQEKGLLELRCSYSGLKGIHDIEIIGSASLTGTDLMFCQGWGMEGPSGVKEPGTVPLLSHGITALCRGREALMIYAADHRRFHICFQAGKESLPFECRTVFHAAVNLESAAGEDEVLPALFLREGADLDTLKYLELIKKSAGLSGNCNANYYLANSVLYEVFSNLFSDLHCPEKAERQTLADDIRFYMDMKYSENIQLKELAGFFHIHPNYLTRIFREKFGISPKQYLTRLKLNQACRLLRSTDMNIALIGAALGFDDQLAFSRTFHSHIGESPRSYRKGADQQ